jgi:hypothetical protein
MGRPKNMSVRNKVVWLSSLLIFSCQPQAPIADVQGNVKVLIPTTAQSSNQLSTVTIKNVSSLKEVSGSYVQFYYTPGSDNGGLVGGAPQAKFIRTGEDVYVPTDSVTQQMFSIYYHIQNLNDFNAEISLELKQTQPFYVGLNTQVSGGGDNSQNNAFFDGDSNALLFVPYNLQHIPISVNSGIIAHEFFHSIFFKHMLKGFNLNQEALIQSAPNTDKFYYNQTLVRGMNEGLADYWGWLYTNDTDYISVSLPKFGTARKMELDAATIGSIETSSAIASKVSEAQEASEKPTEYLSTYIYKIGTPHARFLKELTQRISYDNKTSLKVAKVQMARAIYNYMKNLSATTKAFKAESILDADDMFQYFSRPSVSGINLSPVQCDFVLRYVKTKSLSADTKVCVGTNE